MANENFKTILSGVQQSKFGSFSEAQEAGVRGKLLFARVTGGTDAHYGADKNGRLVEAADADVQGKTYVFMGKKCYGSFPQLPVELINAIGLSIGETNSGVVSSLSAYYTSNNIIDILKEIKQGGNISGKTIQVTKVGTGSTAYTNLEANIDNVTIISGDNGVLSVDSKQLDLTHNINTDVDSFSSFRVDGKRNGLNLDYTIGFQGGTSGDVLMKFPDGHYGFSSLTNTLSINGESGVTVTSEKDNNGVTKYTLSSDLFVSASTSSATSGIACTYTLVDKDGNVHGSPIKTINDVFLKSAEVDESGDVKGIIFTWYVRNESGETLNSTSFIPLTDLDTYTEGSGITINTDTNVISIDLSTEPTNILTFDGEGSGSTLYASAVTDVTLNGTDLDVVNNKVDLGKLVSAITTTYNGEENEDVFSGTVSNEGVLNLNLNLSADTIPFDSEYTSGIIPSISGDNVQEVIEEIVEQLSGATDGILTISANGVEVKTYNPSADTQINITNLISATVGEQKYGVVTAESGNTLVIDSISASAITFNYTGSGNTTWELSGDTNVDETLNAIIDKLNDASVTGLSAISATVTESGTTVQLKLNESNTYSVAEGGIINSTEGATAVGDIYSGNTAYNAVKMHQNAENGLFVYIEICGDDVDEETPTPTEKAITYTANVTGATMALGIEAAELND